MVLCVGTEGFPARAAVACVSVPFVLEVMAHLMGCPRINPGVEARQRVHAERLEMPESVHTGAGGGVESPVWLRDNDLDAHGRSKTQFLTPCRALRSRCIPWLSSETVSAPPPLPYAGRHVSR